MSNQACCPVPESYHSLEELLSHQLFKALGDPNRIRLILALVERCRTCTVGELAECMTVDVSVVSRHLAMLRAAGVLRAEKQGKQVLYTIQFDHLAETLRGIADAIEACKPADADRPAPSAAV
jgi:DNA-binding transcriptional ArsR family regulator